MSSIRSARADNVNGNVPERQHEAAGRLCKDGANAAAPLCLTIRKPFQKALQARQPEGGDARMTGIAFEHRARDLFEFGKRFGAAEPSERSIANSRQHLMHEAATQALIGRSAERRQRFELQDAAGEDRVGIGNPALDFRHAHLARTKRDGGRRLPAL